MGNIRCDNIRYLHRSFHYVFKFSPHNLQRMYHRFQQFVFFTIVWKQFRSLRNTYSYVFNISSDQDILTWFYLSRSSPSSRHTGLLFVHYACIFFKQLQLPCNRTYRDPWSIDLAMYYLETLVFVFKTTLCWRVFLERQLGFEHQATRNSIFFI